MADDATGNIEAHAATYDGFLRLLKFGTIASFLVAAVVVLIIGT